MSTVTPWRAVWLIAKREINTRLRTRSFVVGTAALLVAMLGFLAVQAWISDSVGKSTVGLTGQTTGISEQLTALGGQAGLKIVTKQFPSAEEGRAQVESGDVDALLSGTAAELRVLVKSTLDEKLRGVLDRISQQEVLNGKLSEAGLDPGQVLASVATTRVAVTELKPADPDRSQRLAIGAIVAILLYITLFTYGVMVAQGVVEEKASRVVEILLSTVRPWHLLLGKVIGLGLVGLTQLVILAGVGVLGGLATGVLTLSGVATGALLWGVIWYLLGFLLYATLYGAAGSLVSRQEDTQSVIGPVNLVLIMGFVVGLNLMTSAPDGQAIKIASLVPLLSPILMPGRIAAGTAALWEIAASLTLTLLAVALLTWLGAKIYQNSILRTGSRVKLMDALKNR
ncbi:ABC-2 type transport system permease protein [Amycolatopsis xylanica]|uniref:ABC-2 type transport system permease protein n=1 Tax=Amycolatopsis xylanica TaxID=589385 RepID=A0A1H2Y8W3_9PSEU|nr:ABC transporter permease [Amycolatopsis xylanica]SDX01490.1 ABC-2 type transport system permease protein [Amycolatopsis xylanica]